MIFTLQLACFEKTKKIVEKRMCVITKIDSISYFVFTVKCVSDSNKLIIGEKEKINDYALSNKYILEDSVKQVSYIKNESKYLLVYLENGLTIDGVRIKKASGPINIISNCYSFSN